ncbi:hypothetical protein Cni_G19884 [Canna indica]|uniref:Gcp-like domain-containing protein n=1 Tax=Canna indica TaxID=4628 RepID=A0AAQ3KQB3_9LILI|nr:hypothetical protein Cni_G19884 [Canna indica]
MRSDRCGRKGDEKGVAGVARGVAGGGRRKGEVSSREEIEERKGGTGREGSRGEFVGCTDFVGMKNEEALIDGISYEELHIESQNEESKNEALIDRIDRRQQQRSKNRRMNHGEGEATKKSQTELTKKSWYQRRNHRKRRTPKEREANLGEFVAREAATHRDFTTSSQIGTAPNRDILKLRLLQIAIFSSCGFSGARPASQIRRSSPAASSLAAIKTAGCSLLRGGQNLLILVHKLGHYIQLGTTIDDTIGEAYDKTTRWLGLDMGKGSGPALEEHALEGDPSSINFSLRAYWRSANPVLMRREID